MDMHHWYLGWHGHESWTCVLAGMNMHHWYLEHDHCLSALCARECWGAVSRKAPHVLPWQKPLSAFNKASWGKNWGRLQTPRHQNSKRRKACVPV